MSSKFKVGDKVVVKRLNPRTPRYIRDDIRLDRSRTVVGVFYDTGKQHNNYYLGSNKAGADITDYPFRAEELRKATKRIGRPSERRKYRKKV